MLRTLEEKTNVTRASDGGKFREPSRISEGSMAEEKKPKIDLKARLGKAGGATPPPAGVGGGGIPMPVPTAATNNIPPVAAPSSDAGAGVPPPKLGGAVPPPPGIPVGPPPAFKAAGLALDPSNPLAAAVAPPQPAARPAPAAPAQPQRIEVDEMAVQEARKGARKQGLVGGLVAGLVFAVIGFIAGGAKVTSEARTASVNHAKSLSEDVAKSREQLKTLADKIEAGRNSLAKEHKFPDSLAKDLGGINVDFDGTKLAGVRFSGFSQETTSGLIEYITAVQATNDRKNTLIALLNKLQKPLTEKLAQGNKIQIGYVVVMDKDGAKNSFGDIAILGKPIELSASLPSEYAATNLRTKKNLTGVPKLTNLDKGGAAYITPESMEGACPSETSGQIAQLGGQLSRVINDIRGETPVPGQIEEPKPGLLERADRLVTNLGKVQ